MVIHMFVLKWKPEATAEHRQRALREIKDFANQIPGLLEVHVGLNFGPRSQGYEFGATMKFSDRPAYEAYLGHPAHQQLLDWAGPLVGNAIDLDFED